MGNTHKRRGITMESVTLTARDGYELSLSVFPVESAKGYVQLIHGMEEHKERYDDFARKLNEAGYAVISSDMRGHGTNAPMLGFFKEKDGYQYLLSDQEQITEYIKSRFGVDKVIIFSHSMGTIITRNLLRTHSDRYEKVILSGFPYNPGSVTTGVVIFLCNVIGALRGQTYYSKLVQSVAIGGFNKTIQNPKTELDWLSYNEENIQTYMADNYCGHGFKVSAFRDLFRLVRGMSSPKNYTAVNADLPLLLIRGEDDPSTGFHKGADDSIRVLKEAGFQNLRTNVYTHMRHELLNEDGRDQVIADIVAFLG